MSILQFFVKGMHKMMELISNILCKKNMLPFMQLHDHYVNLMRKKSHETKGCKGNDSFIK